MQVGKTSWHTVVGVRVPVAVVDQERIVVDAIEQVNHLVHGELAVTWRPALSWSRQMYA
jgi:hypothetical protein